MWWLRRHCLRLLADRFGSKAVLCGRGQFESLAPPKNDASGPEQVSGAIIAAPPKGPGFRGFFVPEIPQPWAEPLSEMKPLLVLMVAGLLHGSTLLAVADAAGSAVVYGVKTTVNVLDAVTPDIINRKKD